MIVLRINLKVGANYWKDRFANNAIQITIYTMKDVGRSLHNANFSILVEMFAQNVMKAILKTSTDAYKNDLSVEID